MELSFDIPKKIPFKSTTTLSINERFTQLRQPTAGQSRINNIRQNNAVIRQASIKNRRLAQQMERRPTVMAALRIKKKSIRQRLGPFESGSSMQDRLALPGTSKGYKARGTRRGRGLGRVSTRGKTGLVGRTTVLASPRGIRRSVPVTTSTRGNRGTSIRRRVGEPLGLRRNVNLGQQRVRSVSDQIRTYRVTGNQQVGSRGGRSRGSRLRGGGTRGGQLRPNQQRERGSQVPIRNQPRGSGSRGSFRGNQVRRGQMQQGRGQMQQNRRQPYRNQSDREYEPRGRMRGGRQYQRYRESQDRNQRGTFRGGFRRNRFDPKPSKEELDNELDQYMSNTQSHLDHQLDSYMRRDSSSSWH